MRIGCLQFSPVLGDVEGNIARAESLLEESLASSSSSSSASGLDLDLLMLPELAFSGQIPMFSYNATLFLCLDSLLSFLKKAVVSDSVLAEISISIYSCCSAMFARNLSPHADVHPNGRI